MRGFPIGGKAGSNAERRVVEAGETRYDQFAFYSFQNCILQDHVQAFMDFAFAGQSVSVEAQQMFEHRDFKFAPEKVAVGIIERAVSQTSLDDDGIESRGFRGLTQRGHGPGQNARSLRDTSDAAVRGGAAEGLKIDARQTGQSIIH